MKIVGRINNNNKEDEKINEKNKNLYKEQFKKFFLKMKTDKNTFESSQNAIPNDNYSSDDDLSDQEKLTKRFTKIKVEETKNLKEKIMNDSNQNLIRDYINNSKDSNTQTDSNQSVIYWINFKFSKLKLSKDFSKESLSYNGKLNIFFNLISNNLSEKESEPINNKKEFSFNEFQDKIHNDKTFFEVKRRKEQYKSLLEKLERVHVSSCYISKQEQRNLIYRDILTEEERGSFSKRLNKLVRKEKIKRNNKICSTNDFSDDSIDYSLFDVRKITNKSKVSIQDKISFFKKNKNKGAKQTKNECERDYNKLLNHLKYLDINE